MVGETQLLVAVVSLALGLATGAVMHRADFCLAGVFRDFILFRRVEGLCALSLAIVVTMVFFEAARLIGLLPNYPFPLFYAPTAANVAGGLLFGVGMVLAGGCVVGTLYRMGAGSLVSAAAFVGLVAGSAGYAEIYPAWSALLRRTTVFAGSVTLPQILGVEPTIPVLLSAVAGGAVLLRWGRAGRLHVASPAVGYLQRWIAALALAALTVASAVVVGLPLGVTTSYAKIGAWIERLALPGRYAGLALFKTVPLSYRHPLTGATLTGGPGPQFDAITAIQFPLVAGIVLGAAVSALLIGEWRLGRGAPPRQLASAFIGGLAMGFASRMAPTCNVWHLLGGLPMLAASSFLFLAGLLPGAWIGARLLTTVVLPGTTPVRRRTA